MTGLPTFLAKELREQWRSRRLLAVVIVFAAFGVASPLLARYLPELVGSLAGDEGVTIEIPPATLDDAATQVVRNIGQTGVLAAILLAMGSVATEKERGIAAMWLTKPLSRSAYLGAKIGGIGAVLAAGIAVAGIAAYAYTVFLFEPPAVAGWVAMCVLLLLQLLAYASVTFLGSTLAGSALVAAAIGIGALAVIAIVGALPVIGAWTPSGLADAALALATGDTPEQLWPSIAATVALVAVALGAAALAFRRQDL
jgi:ABC-2 type transport system permease protein